MCTEYHRVMTNWDKMWKKILEKAIKTDVFDKISNNTIGS